MTQAIDQRFQTTLISDREETGLHRPIEDHLCGALQTTKLLSHDFLASVSPPITTGNSSKKRKWDTTKPEIRAEHIGLTPNGKQLVTYMTSAIESGRWDTYFNFLADKDKIYQDYKLWHEQIKKQGKRPRLFMDISLFEKTFYALMPNMNPSTTHILFFPTREECETQLLAIKKEIFESASLHPPGKKRYTPEDPFSLTKKRQLLFQYISDSLPSKWHSYFSKKMSNNVIYQDYYAWVQKHSFKKDLMGLHPLIKTLHKWFPNIVPNSFGRTVYQTFPTEAECKAQWQSTLSRLQSSNPTGRKKSSTLLGKKL